MQLAKAEGIKYEKGSDERNLWSRIYKFWADIERGKDYGVALREHNLSEEEVNKEPNRESDSDDDF
jgi:hypothetical protein